MSDLGPNPAQKDAEGAAPHVASRSRRVARAVGGVLGLMLLGLALWWIWRDQEALSRAWAAARAAPPWVVAALLILPLLSWALTSALFWTLTRPYGRVPAGEMLALIGASWLLNALPLRPGMVGRVAYLKAARGVAVRDSVRVGIVASIMTGLSAGLLAAAALVLARVNAPCAWAAPVTVLAIPAGLASVWVVARRRETAAARRAAHWSGALALRVLDMGVMALRLYLAFVLIGQAVTPAQAVWFAGPAQVAGLLPMHVGVQEWAVGLLAPTVSVGITAALANRAADLLVSICVGSTCLLWLWRRAPGLSRRDPTA